jgi:3-oxoadipate enol-lactonase
MAENIHEWGSARVAEMVGPKLFATGRFEANPQVVQELRQVIARTSPNAIACAQRGMAARPDMTYLLPQIKVPTLVIAGAEDALTPAQEIQQFAAKIPNGKYVEIQDAGHMSPVENPKAVNQAMNQFIANLR